MKVVCDNCRAVYKVSDDKLVKAVNKATCRNCHYRMLIPRPNPGADPNERILVSAVPPADVSSPGRREAPKRRPPPSVPIARSRSLPPGPAPSLPPRPADLRATSIPRSTPGPALERGPVPRPRGPVSTGPVPEAPAPRSRPPGPSLSGPVRRPLNSSLPPGPAMPPAPGPSSAPTSLTTNSLVQPQLSAPPGPRSVEPFRAPTPPPVARPSFGAPTGPAPGHWVSGGPERVSFGGALRSYDPSGDLSWVVVGTTTAAFGAFLLALLAPMATLPVVWMAVVLAIGGAALTIGILWSGARGRRKARAPMVLFVSIPVAVLGATGLIVLKVAGQAALEQLEEFERTGDPFADGLDLEPAPREAPATLPEPEPEPEPVAEPEPEPAPVAAAPRPKPAPARPRLARPKPPPDPRPRPAPPPAPALVPPPAKPSPAPPPLPRGTADDLPSSVSGEAVRLMLTDYNKAKRCFVPLAEAGILPDRVDTRFKIMPDGRAQDFDVLAPEIHTDGELELCLRIAVTALQFPESRSGVQVDYPFILR